MASFRCPQPSTRRACWRVASAMSHMALPRWTPPADPVGFIARAGARDLAGVRIGVGDPFLWRDCDPGIAETVDEAVNALARRRRRARIHAAGGGSRLCRLSPRQPQ